MNMTAKESARSAIDRTHRIVTLPAIAVKLVLGATSRQEEGDVVVGYEGDEIAMSVEDFSLAAKIAVAVRNRMGGGAVTPGAVIDAVDFAKKLISEEIFVPGVVRVLYFPVMSPASMFYRCVMPAVALNDGTRIQAFVSKNRIAREAAEYDIVVFQIDCSPRSILLVRALQDMGKKVVFEIDDAFDALEDWHPGHDAFKRDEMRKNMETMIRQVDALAVSTQPLGDRYAKWAKRVQVIPNAVTAIDWPKPDQKRDTGGEFRLLWAGSISHFGDLEIVGKALSAFANAHENVVLIFFGRPPVGLEVPKEKVEVHEFVDFSSYPLKLVDLAADAAIAPLADVPFNQYKSNVKLLEYGACGYPIVASDVGPYQETITHDVNGYLCRTQDEWVEALERLYWNQDERTRLGKAARELALANDVFKLAPKIETFFVDLVRGEA